MNTDKDLDELADTNRAGRMSRWTNWPPATTVILTPSIATPWAILGTAVAVVAGLGLITFLVYQTGGAQHAYSYLILLPVILAGVQFKIPGGVVVAVIAGMLLGPWMPLDVASGTMQSIDDWSVPLGVYILIGGFSGIAASALSFFYFRGIAIERTDPISGLLSHFATERLAADGILHLIAGYNTSHVVAVEFEGYDEIVLAMGTEVGNKVIRRLGKALDQMAEGKYIVTRFEGATFGILMPGKGRDVMRLLKKCLLEVPSAIQIDDLPLTLLPRFGIAKARGSNRRVPLRQALVALRHARINRRRVYYYNTKLDDDARDNLALLSEFREDLEAGLCDVHFQPKLDLATNRIYGAEALLRWTSAKRGMVPPGRIVPIVERTLLIRALTLFVVERSALALAAWRRDGMDISVAINISAHNLEDRELVDLLIKVPETYGVPAHAIELELTETAVMDNIQSARVVLEKLRAVGYRIAIDDFGTSQASLGYLKELPIDCVKLDQSFVLDLPGNAFSREICMSTASMCKRLGFHILAEGVENAEALQFLREQGYDAIQGYHIARPMALADLQKWLADYQVEPMVLSSDVAATFSPNGATRSDFPKIDDAAPLHHDEPVVEINRGIAMSGD